TVFLWNGKHRTKFRPVHLPIAREKRSPFITPCIRPEPKTSHSSSASRFQRIARPMLGWSGIPPAAHTYSIQQLTGRHVARTDSAEVHIFPFTLTRAAKNFAPPRRRPCTRRRSLGGGGARGEA